MVATEELWQRDEVAERFAHLLSVDGNHVVVEPVSHHLVTLTGHSLGDLTLVMWENQVHTTTVNVEVSTQVFLTHRSALAVPSGLFSVSEGHRVFFSQGNLQYKASTNTWKFADNQWDYVGDGNVNVSDTYDGWIDLFGWGTSGYDHGADCYQPWCWVGNYYAYGDPSYNLNDQTGQADWGYNPIVNGGNQEAQWRTLTKEEWDYLINERNTPSGIRYAFAWVDGITGVVLLPDDWNASYHELNNVNTAAAFFTNQISYSQWQLMEQHGAVFLPAAGHRMNQPPEVGYLGICGYYWSATANGSGMAWYLGFSNAINTSAYLRLLGYSVRLVQDVPNGNDRNNGGEGRK